MKLNHNQIDTEHLLLRLMQGIQTVEVLQGELGVNLEELEMEVKAMSKNTKDATNVELPGDCFAELVAMANKNPRGFTPAVNQVFQYAMEEAQKVESDYVLAEHILLGLIREKNGIAAKALANFGVTLERVRKHIDPRPMLKFQHRSWQLNLNNVDKEIRDLVYLLNEVPFLETSSSCSGHPDIPTREWRDGGICVDPTWDVDPVWDFLECLRARLDNNRGLELSQVVKNIHHVNRTLTFFKQVNGEALYISAIPILTTSFFSFIRLRANFDKLPLMWNIVNRITQEFISSSEILPPIGTPESGAEAFVNLLQSAPHIQEISAGNYHKLPLPQGGADVYFLWNSASIRWGWDFMNYLRAHFEKEFESFDVPKSGFSFRTSFAIKPIVKREGLQRTREDHLKIWKLIELAAREYIHGEL